jgi:hypothetical protein
VPFEDICIQIELILLETKRFFVGRCDPDRFPHREGLYHVHQVHQVDLWSGEVKCFEFIYLSCILLMVCEERVSCILMLYEMLMHIICAL